jgi:hypothetical protein
MKNAKVKIKIFLAIDGTHPSLGENDCPKPSSGLCSEKSQKSPNNIIGMMDSNRDILFNHFDEQ